MQRASERPVAELPVGGRNSRNVIRLERVVVPAKGQRLPAGIRVIGPRVVRSAPISPAGEEVGCVLEGHRELLPGAERCVLEAGDSFPFPGDTPHVRRNPSRARARMLRVDTLPTL